MFLTFAATAALIVVLAVALLLLATRKNRPVVAAALIAIIGLAFASQPALAADPLPSPWDFEAQLKASPTIAAMQQQLADHEARLANCPCTSGVVASATGPFVLGSQPLTIPLTPASTSTIVRHADGSLWQRTCTAEGCRETPTVSAYNQTAGFTAAPCASGNCGQFAQPPSFASAANLGRSGQGGAGGCANGQCGGASRGMGGVVGVGGRVLFWRRR